MRRVAPALAFLALAVACASTPARTPAIFPALQQTRVEATSATGTHRFGVWIAADDRSRARGLMYVRELPADRGMLFLFDRPQELAFWMKDTYLPLDLVFIAGDGRVLNVAENARPFSLDPLESEGPAIAVLEVLGGTARRIGLKPGDLVTWPTLRTTGEARPEPDTSNP
jgi:uncharacterized membrane protein (UPF0127 family)